MEDTKNSLIIALQHHDIFDLESPNADTEVLPKGIAFSFIKAVHAVNQRLVSHNSSESLGFEVILIANECSEESKVKIVENVKHYGMEICKFYFCKKDEVIKTLQSNNVKLFLSTDSDEIYKALHADVPAAVLYDQTGVLDQLKVTFSGDIIGLPEDSLDSLADLGFSEAQIKTFKSAKICMKEFAGLIGEMRRRFGHENSPLCTCLITVWGSRNICLSALKTLGGWGLDVDEAFCMAGAPCSPILALVKPHILWDGGLHNLRDVPNFEL
ncbi:cytosolic 5'-nucleotidase 1B isoform X1 [Triplophysa rosa]|uniref:cytosolic 5'-nucleotidase 1B isoform X1 n=1 Tax=Triplophysa rosa TaxID=992332 RepID=UPI0025462349|nr:cytosolic 5'-nucleotidase 1B isoform X1 [Triplophysa rosa]